MTASICKVEKRSRGGACRGFTLVEIMITMALVSILGGISWMSARELMSRMRVDRVSSRLAFQLQQVRAEAIANNQTVFVRLKEDENVLRIWVDGNRDGVRDTGEISEVALGEAGTVDMDSDWETGAFNAYGQFITTPGQREMRTVRTVITTPGVDKSIELTIRGSGAITKR